MDITLNKADTFCMLQSWKEARFGASILFDYGMT